MEFQEKAGTPGETPSSPRPLGGMEVVVVVVGGGGGAEINRGRDTMWWSRPCRFTSSQEAFNVKRVSNVWNEARTERLMAVCGRNTLICLLVKHQESS